jgi:hypothetical protein
MYFIKIAQITHAPLKHKIYQVFTIYLNRFTYAGWRHMNTNFLTQFELL